jgi:hypothetical protein
MADKTDMGKILPILERLCMEHRVMRTLLSEDRGVWTATAVQMTKQAKHIDAIRTQFRELNESLQSDQPDAELVQKLLEALNKSRI